jgi:V/A-type H+-transporting ATPase subunit E
VELTEFGNEGDYMEVKLENLIKKIKEEGVGAADKKAAEILEKTRKEADSILEKARKEADKIREEAEKEAKKHLENADASIRQAARDTILSLKKQLKNLFDRLLKQKIDEELDEELLRDMILKLMDSWAKEKDVSIVIGKGDAEKLTSLVMKELKAHAKNGIDIKLDKKVSSGFRIGLKDDDLTYDFTDDALLESLRFFLNPKLSELLEEKSGK